MRIVTARRISQAFFLLLFLWLCVVATLGTEPWQLRGWPIDWLLSLDPLTALTTVLATGTLFAPLAWALVTVVLTVLLGRVFCGFVCPLGALNQLLGWLGRLGWDTGQRLADNRYSPWQGLKYVLLAVFLAMALGGWSLAGLLDPLPLAHRAVNLGLLPLADAPLGIIHEHQRSYAGVWLPAGLLVAILGLNLLRPRFFCRYACPLGALLGVLSRFALLRMGRGAARCGDCQLCETHCEGACRPAGEIITGECLMCMNCLDRCPAGRISFAAVPSAGGETTWPSLSRRGLLAGTAAGLLAVPLWRLGALAGAGRDPGLLRPPGSLDEDRFLARCIRCGQCMRACPSNIIQPALLQSGVQGLWSPVLDYRLGRSGCQINCVTCGNVCPTAAIRPLSLEEKHGAGNFAERGPVRLGTAFVDRTRCLPWAMGRPCIVCQEVCPVSPKAISTRLAFEPLSGGVAAVRQVQGRELTLGAGLQLPAGLNLAGGDYFLRPEGREDLPPARLASLADGVATLAEAPAWADGLGQGGKVEILARLQRPVVDPSRCIGCGMCEHDCPVSSLRAIRVTNEGESRTAAGRMLA